MRRKARIVTVKVQRPIVSTGNMTEVLSYIVDEDDEALSNPAVTVMEPKAIFALFGEGKYHKVYYLAIHKKGKPVKLTEPTRQDEWE